MKTALLTQSKCYLVPCIHIPTTVSRSGRAHAIPTAGAASVSTLCPRPQSSPLSPFFPLCGTWPALDEVAPTSSSMAIATPVEACRFRRYHRCSRSLPRWAPLPRPPDHRIAAARQAVFPFSPEDAAAVGVIELVAPAPAPAAPTPLGSSSFP